MIKKLSVVFLVLLISSCKSEKGYQKGGEVKIISCGMDQGQLIQSEITVECDCGYGERIIGDSCAISSIELFSVDSLGAQVRIPEENFMGFIDRHQLGRALESHMTDYEVGLGHPLAYGRANAIKDSYLQGAISWDSLMQFFSEGDFYEENEKTLDSLHSLYVWDQECSNNEGIYFFPSVEALRSYFDNFLGRGGLIKYPTITGSLVIDTDNLNLDSLILEIEIGGEKIRVSSSAKNYGTPN